MWYAKVLVEIACSSNLPVCFIDCVEEVGAHYYDVDAPSITDKFLGAWLRFWIAGSNAEVVPDALHPSCDQLGKKLSVNVSKFASHEGGDLHLGERSSQQEKVTG